MKNQTNWRELCEELVEAWDKHGGNWLPSHEDAWFSAIDRARAVLARYGHQPAPPAEGEVAELALKELERTMVLLMPVTGKNKIKRFDTIRAEN